VTTSFSKQSVHRQQNDKQFSILARARSAFHLSALEVTYIKTLKPKCTLQEKICLFFTNFPLVSVFQYNANSMAIF